MSTYNLLLFVESMNYIRKRW